MVAMTASCCHTPPAPSLHRSESANSDCDLEYAFASSVARDCEAVEQPCSARPHEILLTASTRGVSRIPGNTAAIPVMVADLSCTFAVTGPVLACVVRGVRVRPSVRLRAGQNVVRVRLVPQAIYHRALLTCCIVPGDQISRTCQVDRVAMQLSEVAGHHRAVGVMPRTFADAVPGAHRRLSITRRRAQISSPSPVAGSRGGRQLLAVSIGARESSQVGAIAGARTCDEEGHRRPLLLLLGRLSEHRRHAKCEQEYPHRLSPRH